MPPSGYPRRDAQTIAHFLSSCVDALEAENATSGRAPTESLKREIAGIDSVLAQHAEEPFALHTLWLTRAFYARVLSYEPRSSSELRKIVPEVLEEVMAEITSVHVEDYALPSR
jgi:hypothetical protein